METVQTTKTSPLLFSARIVVASHFIKKNSKAIRWRKSNAFSPNRGGSRLTPFIANTEKQKLSQDFLVRALSERARRICLCEPISYQVRCVFKFYYPRSEFFTKKGLQSKRLADLSNLCQGPEDSLERAGILENDSQISSLDGSRRLWHDSHEHILEIEIYKFEE